VQVIAWKDLSPKWHITCWCWAACNIVLTYSLTHCTCYYFTACFV